MSRSRELAIASAIVLALSAPASAAQVEPAAGAVAHAQRYSVVRCSSEVRGAAEAVCRPLSHGLEYDLFRSGVLSAGLSDATWAVELEITAFRRRSEEAAVAFGALSGADIVTVRASVTDPATSEVLATEEFSSVGVLAVQRILSWDIFELSQRITAFLAERTAAAR